MAGVEGEGADERLLGFLGAGERSHAAARGDCGERMFSEAGMEVISGIVASAVAE